MLNSGPQEESDLEEDDANDSTRAAQSQSQSQEAGQLTTAIEGEVDASNGTEVLERSRSRLLIEDMLARYYTPLEVWYARTVIDKVMILSQRLSDVLIRFTLGTSTVHVRPYATSCLNHHSR